MLRLWCSAADARELPLPFVMAAEEEAKSSLAPMPGPPRGIF
jgi:hypothetical protein